MKKYPPLTITGTTIHNGRPAAMRGEIVPSRLGAYLVIDWLAPVSIDKLDADFISSINLSIKCKTEQAAQFYCAFFNRNNQQKYEMKNNTWYSTSTTKPPHDYDGSDFLVQPHDEAPQVWAWIAHQHDDDDGDPRGFWIDGKENQRDFDDVEKYAFLHITD